MEHEEKEEPENKRIDGVRWSMIMDRWEMILETWTCRKTEF